MLLYSYITSIIHFSPLCITMTGIVKHRKWSKSDQGPKQSSSFHPKHFVWGFRNQYLPHSPFLTWASLYQDCRVIFKDGLNLESQDTQRHQKQFSSSVPRAQRSWLIPYIACACACACVYVYTYAHAHMCWNGNFFKKFTPYCHPSGFLPLISLIDKTEKFLGFYKY